MQKQKYNCTECGELQELTDDDVATCNEFDCSMTTCAPCADRLHDTEIANEAQQARNTAFLATVPTEYAQTDETHPEFNSRLNTAIREIDGWIGIVGKTGLSKTRCVAMLVKKLIIEDGQAVTWARAAGFESMVWANQNQFTKGNDKDRIKAMIKGWHTCQTLVIDDLGKEKVSETFETFLYGLIEYRHMNQKRIIWTANTHPKNGTFSEDRGGPIVGRLLEKSTVFNVDTNTKNKQ